MLKDSRPCLVFATILFVLVATRLEASGVSNVPEEPRQGTELQFRAEAALESTPAETFRVPIWIPGFDDDEPVSICSPIPSPIKARFGKRVSLDDCNRMLRMLPWILNSAPTRRVNVLLPIV